MPGLDPGSYLVLFSPVCLAGFPRVAPQWFNGQRGAGLATPVTVAADRTTAFIDARLAAYGSISGTVTDLAHAAVAGICVTAVPDAHGSVPVSAVTAADGSFSIADLAPGKYLVRFDPGCGARGYLTQWYSGASVRSGATPVTVAASAATTNVNASVRR